MIEDAAGTVPDAAAPPVTRVTPWALYAGLALVTCSMLLVQQFLTRVFSIQFNSGLAFLAISTTFLGLGSAGVAVVVLPRWFQPARLPRLLPWVAVAFALLLVVGFAAEVVVDRVAQQHVTGSEPLSSQVRRVVVGSLFLLPAMVAAGLVISLVLRAHGARVNRLYGADLCGGGVGCLLVLPLMNLVGGDSGIFAIGALAALGAVLLAHAHGHDRARAAATLLLAVFGLLPLANRDRALIDVQTHRTIMSGVDRWVDEDRELARDWNELSRLTFFPTEGDRELYIRIDSSCQTTAPSTDPDKIRQLLAQTDFQRLPFVLDRHRRCLEIGAGGGRGILLANASGAEHITGVEINPGIVAAALGSFPGYGVRDLIAGGDGRIQLQLGEGRSYVRRLEQPVDSLTITFIQTGVASGSAAFALSEANLFTVEAFADFLGKLTPDGVFYVYRHGGIECLRMVSMFREVYRQLGVDDFQRHLYIARNQGNAVVVLAARSPLQPDEIARLDRASAELHLEVLYGPGAGRETRPENPFLDRVAAMRRDGSLTMGRLVATFDATAHDPAFAPIEGSYVRAAEPASFLRDCPVDVSAPTDDRPYFFFTGLSDVADFGLYFDAAGTGILGGTVVMLFWMAVAFSLLVAVMIVLPLVLRRRGDGDAIDGAAGAVRRRGFWVVLYFAGIGMGYIAVQISFIQRFSLFLGHPVYAIAVVLLAFLVASGLGSLCSDRLFRSGLLSFHKAVALLAAVLLLFNWLLPSVFHSGAIAWPVPAKILLSLLLLFVLAFPMGVFFPQGVRLCDRVAPGLSPWAWGANSAASVIGSILALILAIHQGFAVVAVVAVAIYALTTLPAVAMLQRR